MKPKNYRLWTGYALCYGKSLQKYQPELTLADVDSMIDLDNISEISNVLMNIGGKVKKLPEEGKESISWKRAFALMSRYYGFTINEIGDMSIYQFSSYLGEIPEVEKCYPVVVEKKTKDTTTTEDLMKMANKKG